MPVTESDPLAAAEVPVEWKWRDVGGAQVLDALVELLALGGERVQCCRVVAGRLVAHLQLEELLVDLLEFLPERIHALAPQVGIGRRVRGLHLHLRLYLLHQCGTFYGQALSWAESGC